MKKKDWIYIFILLILLGIGYFFILINFDKKETIEVYYHNEVIDTIDIHKDNIYTFQGDYGSFSLEVNDNQYRAIDVECPNHDCEHVGWVKQGSVKQIICVPNQIYIVQTEEKDI